MPPVCLAASAINNLVRALPVGVTYVIGIVLIKLSWLGCLRR
jgi:hypothetical protein